MPPKRVAEQQIAPLGKKPKNGLMTLTLNLETVAEQRELVEFPFDGTDIQIPGDCTINDLCDKIETVFVEASLDFAPEEPLELNIITLQKKLAAGAGGTDVLNYMSLVSDSFEDGSIVSVLGEIDVPDIPPESDYEPEEPIKKIPVSVITGFLGAGKTTLLNHILTEQHGRRIAVMENEFGEMSIDDKLLKQKLSAAEQIVVADNGCVCCTVRGDLVKMIDEILDRNLTLPDEKKIEAIMLETTGMADPSPVLQTFFASTRVMKNCTIDGVITVVDCKNLMKHLRVDPGLADKEGAAKKDAKDQPINESVQQIAFADRILINKIDLATQAEVKDVMAEIRSINKTAKVIRSVQSKVDINKILDIGCFDLKRIESQIDPEFAEAVNDDNAAEKKEDHGHGHGHGNKEDQGHGHGHGKKEDHGHDGHGHGKKEDHGHGHGHGKKEGHGHDGHGHGHGKGECTEDHDHSKHRHNQRVSSIGFVLPGEIDAEAMDDWWQELMKTQSKKIYRSKGILAMHGNPEKMVFQAVHEILDFQGLGLWKEGEKKENKMIFIGEDLNKKVLEDSFRMCLHKPAL